MTSERDRRSRHSSKDTKHLVPTGSVDEVLLTGSTGGKNLTLFQSVGLIVTGLGVGLGVGASAIASALNREPTFHRNYGQLFTGGVFGLWGAAMVVYGVMGVVKIAGKRR